MADDECFESVWDTFEAEPRWIEHCDEFEDLEGSFPERDLQTLVKRINAMDVRESKRIRTRKDGTTYRRKHKTVVRRLDDQNRRFVVQFRTTTSAFPVRKILQYISELCSADGEGSHVNSGVHGNKEGAYFAVAPKYRKRCKDYAKPINFVQEDLESIEGVNIPVSHHPVTSLCGPLYPSNARFIINGWCYSDNKGCVQCGAGLDGVDGMSKETRVFHVGPIWGQHEAKEKVHAWLQSEQEAEGWKWTGHWWSKNGTSYAKCYRFMQYDRVVYPERPCDDAVNA